MTHRLATNCAKNYCNRTLIVKVIVENVVTCFFGTRCRHIELYSFFAIHEFTYSLRLLHDVTPAVSLCIRH